MKKNIVVALIALGLAASASLAMADTTAYQTQTTHKTKALSKKVYKKPIKKPASVKTTTSQLRQVKAQTVSLDKQVKNLQAQVNVLQQKQMTLQQQQTTGEATMQKRIQDVASRYSHGLAVVASPFLGRRDVYSVYDLIVNLSSMNQDLTLLKQRQRLENYAIEHNETIPDRPLIDLSGDVEGQIIYNHDYVGPTKTDIDLSGAQLDVVGEVSPWATAAAFFSYEKYAPVTGTRVSNSRVKLSRGFLTIGNLNKAPVYFTLGQIYVPFGLYSNFIVSDPVTQTLARVKTRAAVLGLSTQPGFYGAVYAFHGDSYVNNASIINQWGANAGFGRALAHDKLNFDFGAGYIANMADSEGMQYTGAQTGFTGFASYSNANYSFAGHEKLKNMVPGADFHLSLGYNPFTSPMVVSPFMLVTEYITALRSFDVTDLSFNNKGAMPAALDIEGVYNFQILGKNSSFTLGYGRTWQTLAINIPEQSYIAALSCNIWRYTIESLEFRHDRNYSATDTASGANLPAFTQVGARDRNTLTAQVGVYF